MIRKILRFIEKIKYKNEALRIRILCKSKNKVKCRGKINLLNSNVKFGKNCILYPNVSFEGNGLITIGDNTRIGTNTIISSNACAGVEIGKNCSIAGNCYIIDSNHSYKKGVLIREQDLKSEKVVLGEDVWLGANTVVIKGSNIGNGVVVGANSLVNSTIESNTVVVGSPAKKIKIRV